jgi:UDP-N-acetylmuramoyl-L-alanyl-D-glutamate--2,6-diaminopimelate ligase
MLPSKISDLVKREICTDSRKIESGCVFVAIKGANFNGEEFIEEAINKGAAYIVASENYQPKQISSKYVFVDDVRSFVSQLAAQKYQNKISNIVAVTGTNGKTSVAHFFQKLCSLIDLKAVSIGTLGVQGIDTGELDLSSLTTLPPLELHQALAYLADQGCSHVALEASSHGIEQYRVDNIDFQAAAFTNLTQDHLDYHSSLEEYFAAKSRLFKELLTKNATAVINADTLHGKELIEICKKRSINVIDYGVKANSFQINSFERKEVTLLGKKYHLNSNIKGDFQLYNMLAALGLAYSCGIELDSLLENIKHLRAPKGRLEYVISVNRADIYVDYAHTPDSLKNVLKTAKAICKGKLHVLFGCGGDRDKSKRALMGQVADNSADFAYITDDNPRTEDAISIREEIKQHCAKGVDVGNRAAAISYAMQQLEPQDILVIAGKGHEDYQIIGKKKFFFSDHEEVKNNFIAMR